MLHFIGFGKITFVSTIFNIAFKTYFPLYRFSDVVWFSKLK